jgi:hypothetical protein
MNITLAIIISFAVSLVVTAALGYVLIPVLHKLKFGQNILTDIGPAWHAKKQGTPTMGGTMFIIGTIFTTVLAILICIGTGFSPFSDMAELKNQIVSNAEIHDGFMISLTTADSKNIRIITSSAADDMLSIDGVRASFVLSKLSVGKVQISARSLGEENVQLIMEKLGGGGHQSMAGTQIKEVSAKEAYIKLTNAIDAYLEEQGRIDIK